MKFLKDIVAYFRGTKRYRINSGSYHAAMYDPDAALKRWNEAKASMPEKWEEAFRKYSQK